jgi:Domain of unknown function (DUF4160)
MPTVAIVDGVKIQLYAKEHPPPHFHAVMAEYKAQIEIESLRVLNGKLPPAIQSNVLLWARPRRQALRHAWDEIQAKRKPERIP